MAYASLVGLERAGEQAVLGHRLRRLLGIDARASEKKHPLHALPVRGVQGVRGDGEVVVQEFRRTCIVGMDTAHPGRGDDRRVGLFGGEERLGGGLAREVKLLPGAKHERNRGIGPKPAHERGPDHALMACDIEFHGASSG